MSCIEQVNERDKAIISCWESFEKNGIDKIEFIALDDYCEKYCDWYVKEEWSRTTYIIKCITLCNITSEILNPDVNKYSDNATLVRNEMRKRIRNKY